MNAPKSLVPIKGLISSLLQETVAGKTVTTIEVCPIVPTDTGYRFDYMNTIVVMNHRSDNNAKLRSSVVATLFTNQTYNGAENNAGDDSAIHDATEYTDENGVTLKHKQTARVLDKLMFDQAMTNRYRREEGLDAISFNTAQPVVKKVVSNEPDDEDDSDDSDADADVTTAIAKKAKKNQN